MLFEFSRPRQSINQLDIPTSVLDMIDIIYVLICDNGIWCIP